MSERDTPDRADGTSDEPVLARWSRLKASARARAAQANVGTIEPAREAQPAPAAAEPVATAPIATEPTAPEPSPPVQLPDLEQLGDDSDYSAFLTPGVDADLRQRALRKLFRSPKFNVFDGLDTYRGDFTSFPGLGDVVTVDMRYQLERAAKQLVARAEAITGDAPADPAVIAPAAPAAAAIEHVTPAGQATTTVAPEPARPDDPATVRNEDDAEHGPA